MAVLIGPEALTWGIAGLATAGVIARPFHWPEAIWAVSGAAVLLVLGLLPLREAWLGIEKGTDVYLFLTGMMLLSELARREGLFDWLAARATEHARGSPSRLFALIYGTGILVTVFLSNDATAIVLTPAVYAAARVAKVGNPIPYLLICAFIANAASFVLPISNPANLVVYGGGHMPPLAEWTAIFLLPSLMAIFATYAALWVTQRKAVACDTVASDVPHRELSHSAKLAGIGIAATAVILLFASFQNLDLGFCTFVTGGATAATILALNRESPTDVLKHISWSVIPLVAGLFVLVEALNWTGVVALLSDELRRATEWSVGGTTAGSGVVAAIASNLLNNLPTGLVAGSAVQDAGVPNSVSGAVLIGVDLGPNLSVTGSLATILWLAALRREGLNFGAWTFLKIGLVVMPPALLLSLGSLLLLTR